MSTGTKGSIIIVIAFLHLNLNLKEHQHRESLVPRNTSTGNTVRPVLAPESQHATSACLL